MPEELDLPEADKELTPIAAEGVTAPRAKGKDEPEPIRLVDTDEGHAAALKAFGAATAAAGKKAEFHRPLNLPGTGATRCRIFSSKIQYLSLEYMENQINAWIDGEKIEVKHVGHVIGIMEGKRPEPNVIVMVWF